ncbi:MAG: amidohydrolase family protein [Sphingobium sp.]
MELVLRNARIVDGSGGAAFKGDIGIEGRRIAAVGEVPATGTREIDLAGAVVTPGFIDVHTHYDAQVMWDPYLTPSIFHGVTTVIGGNCGFTLAPLSGRAEDADYLVRMLSRVEGIPLPTLRKEVVPDWTDFAGYLGRIERGIGPNAAFLVGHSALRRSVMGDRAVGHEATPDEIEHMAALLRAALEDGGVGFSTSIAVSHTDYEGEMVPSRWASRDELLRLAEVAGEFEGTWLEIAFAVEIFGEKEYALMADMSARAKRFINWNMLTTASEKLDATASQLAASDYAAARGGMVVALVPAVPLKALLNFVSGFLLDTLPGWSAVLMLPTEEKIAALQDPAVRAELAAGVARCESPLFRQMFSDWSSFTLEDTGTGANAAWRGRTVGEYAAHVGKPPLEALLDLVVEEKLQVSFARPPSGDDAESWDIRARAWQDDRCVVGASDAGAHLDMINTFAFSTQLLGEGYRERGLLSLEQAVRCLTAVPAERFGLKDRGTIAPGAWADLVVLDPSRVGCGPIETRNDLPGGQLRLYAEAEGITHVIVGGDLAVEDGALTGALPGQVLRSGRDTLTVAVD